MRDLRNGLRLVVKPLKVLYCQSGVPEFLLRPGSGSTVTHVASAWQNPLTSELKLFRGAHLAPPTHSDWFIRNFARARANVLLTTGKTLRGEPDFELTKRLDSVREGLTKLRALHLASSRSLTPFPRAAVLTRSNFTAFLDHPFIQQQVELNESLNQKNSKWPLIVNDQVCSKDRRSPSLNQENTTGIRAAVKHVQLLLRDEQPKGKLNILIEAGFCASELYRCDDCLVDELFMGIFFPRASQAVAEAANTMLVDGVLPFDVMTKCLPHQTEWKEFPGVEGIWKFAYFSKKPFRCHLSTR